MRSSWRSDVPLYLPRVSVALAHCRRVSSSRTRQSRRGHVRRRWSARMQHLFGCPSLNVNARSFFCCQTRRYAHTGRFGGGPVITILSAHRVWVVFLDRLDAGHAWILGSRGGVLLFLAVDSRSHAFREFWRCCGGCWFGEGISLFVKGGTRGRAVLWWML